MSKTEKLFGMWRRVKPTHQEPGPAPAAEPQVGSQGSRSISLDLAYYRGSYSDLAHMDDAALEAHWHAYGYREGRHASALHAGHPGDATESISEALIEQATQTAQLVEAATGDSSMAVGDGDGSVDLEFYLALYPDLKPSGIHTQAGADAHFQQHGKQQGWVPSLAEWSRRHHLPDHVIPSDFSLSDVLRRSAELGVEVKPQSILDTLLGEHVVPVALAETPARTHVLFFKLGKHFLANQQRQKGRDLLEAGLSFASTADALELLGNSYLDEGHHSIALHYYNAAAELPNVPKWAAFNRASCLAKLHRLDEAIAVLAEGIAREPNFRQQHDELDRLAEQRWSSIQAELLTWVDVQDRERLIQEARVFATRLYRAYLPVFGSREVLLGDDALAMRRKGDKLVLPLLPELGQLNTNRVLIVGDFHVPQCERYRIHQKIEQLEAVGKQATAINWMELEQHLNALAFHDVVIFYRVPAVPKVIKAIAQVNATGKLSLYEIDDLLFEAEYPPAIGSYGGYVSLETYRGLVRGMALFNAAAGLCRQGIASTEPLRERLAPLVQEQRCWLHRNGLDHLNQFRTLDKSHKQTIDIFYGSGTQAHNSDFIEQALPAIERVLKEVPQARLVVVGYLRLPKDFRTRFARQYTQLPAVKSVQGYWSLLEQADINIAVLHDDSINACKSELKWFEAACFGIPSVLSSTANYRDVIREGEDAFLATTSDEWYSGLKQLAGSADLRQRMGQAAMQRARDDYSLEVLGAQLAKQLDASVGAATQPRKRKLALVNVFFPPQSIGGATRVVADNFSALHKHYADELEVCVFTADAECRTPHEMTVYEYQGSRVYRATTLWREHMDWHHKDPEMYHLFSQFLELEQPDIIHFHCVQRLTASIVAAARDAGIPYMVTAHDAWWISDFQFLVDHNGKVYPQGHPDPYQSIELPPNMTLADSIERRRDLKDLLHGARKVLTVSNAFAEIYRKNGIAQIQVIANGISDDLPWAPKDTGHTDRVVCGHIGSMSEHKGYYLLKDAVLKTQPENLEFLVVDHAQEEDYKHHSYWGKVPVTFIGGVEQGRIVELYRKLDVLFAPSTWPESFGLVTREAAACGCWVVASNMGGIGEDVVEGRSGHVIEPTLEALIAQLEAISKNAGRYKQAVAQPARIMAVEQAKELVELYNGVRND